MPSNTPHIFTIGAYGKTEAEFFDLLAQNKINVFCDIRRRRGMRGTLYSFANSQRLQARLASLAIQYRHFLDLAPSSSTRGAQILHDKLAGEKKRSRTELSEEFKSLYRNECLARFNSAEFIKSLGQFGCNIVLFCVEGNPRACHRSLVADQLSSDLGILATHL
jgi:uncharacterized protein (DUF488 family)